MLICFECTDSRTYPDYYTDKQAKKYGINDLAFAGAAYKAYTQYKRRQRKLKSKRKSKGKYKHRSKSSEEEQQDFDDVYADDILYKDYLTRWERYFTIVGADLYDHKKRSWQISNH